MFIDEIKIWNFRKYGSNEEVDLDKPNLVMKLNEGLNLIVGENDSGKTAIIDAIKIALKTSSYEWIRLSHEDFFPGSNRIRIEITIKNLSQEDLGEFVEYLSFLKADKEMVPFLRLIYEANIRNGKIHVSDLKAGTDDIGKILPSELRELLKATYLKPLRDAQNELVPRKNSRISQIFQEHTAFRDSEEHILLELYREFNTAINYYFDGKDKDGIALTSDLNGKSLRDELEKHVKGFFDSSTQVDISTTRAEMRKILENLEINMKDTINPGLGSLNRLFMAVELVNLYKSDMNGLKVALIEEIEAHLHPQVQLKVIESILEQKNVQYIITSHSPNLASLVQLDKIHICKNNDIYSLSSEYTNLEKDNYIFLEKFLDVTKSNIFFANGLIFVEGWAEELLLPAIAKHIGLDLVKREVSLINVGNLGFSNYYRIFSRKDNKHMNIPISIVTDCDIREYYYEEDQLCKKDTTIYETECSNKVSELDQTVFDPAICYMSSEWTLEWCLFKSRLFNSKFEEVCKKIHSKTTWDDFGEKLAEKLIKKSLKKTEIAYQLAICISKGEITFSEEDLKADKYLKYLYEGIKNACR